MRLLIRLMALGLAAFVVITPLRTSAAQRMVLAPGVFNVAANGAQSLSAFCLDFIEHAPESGTTYGNAFASLSDASVKIGDVTYSLQDAVDRHLVSIHGVMTHYTSAQLLNAHDPMGLAMATRDYLLTLPKDQRRHLLGLMAQWDTLAPAQRSELSATLDKHIEQSGDFSRLTVANHTSSPLSITVRNAHVGERNNPISNVDLTHLPAGAIHSDVQYGIWLQRLLQDTGYYDGPINGMPTDRLKNAVHAFQARHPESIDVSLNEALDALRTATENTQTLQHANARRDIPYATVMVETADPGSSYARYRASAGGSVLYEGDSVPALMRRVNKYKSDSKRSDIFLVGTGLPTHDQAIAFRTSVESAQKGIDETAYLHIATTDSDTPLQPLFEGRTAAGAQGDIVRASLQGAPERLTSGSYSGWFMQKVKLWYSNGVTAIIYVAAATRDLLAAAVQHVTDAVEVIRVQQRGSLAGSSPDAIAAYALHTLKAGGVASKDEVAHKIRMNIGGIQISLRGPRWSTQSRAA